MSSYTPKKALIVGTVRNAEKNVGQDVKRILSAIENCVTAQVFIVESDSNDGTVKSLESLASDDSRVEFVSLGAVAPVIPDRIERLRHCRNRYIEEIRKNPKYQDCDIIVIADLDGINTKVTANSFNSAFSVELSWDALAANQTRRYYDILALRHPAWSPNNWINEFEWMKTFIGKNRALKHSMADRMIRIPKNSPPIKVDSAFGGLCIYKRWVLEKCDYSDGWLDEIDHVTLNRRAIEQGANIYIIPGFINSAWTNHSLNSLAAMRFVKKVIALLPLKRVNPLFHALFNSLAK